MVRVLLAFLATLAIASITPATASMDDPEAQVVALVNSVRAQYGLPALTLSPELTTSAQGYAQTMARLNFFGHQGPDGSRLDTRDEAAGYVDWTFLAENLAAGQPTADQAVKAWIASPTHFEDMVSPNARETGVGFALAPGSKYVFYWVQEFGDRAPLDFTYQLPASATSILAPTPWAYNPSNPGLQP